MTDTCLPDAFSRRESRRQDRRAAILSVATRHFLDHGYAGTAMSAIAAELGGSKATLWSYFPSKEALFAAAVDEAATAFRVRLSAMLDPEGPLRPALTAFCTGILEKLTRPESVSLHRLVVAEAGRFPEMGRIFYERAPALTWALLGRFLAGAMERGQMRPGDPIEAARMLMSITMSGCHQRLLMGLIERPAPGSIDADVDHAVALFFRAYGID